MLQSIAELSRNAEQPCTHMAGNKRSYCSFFPMAVSNFIITALHFSLGFKMIGSGLMVYNFDKAGPSSGVGAGVLRVSLLCNVNCLFGPVPSFNNFEAVRHVSESRDRPCSGNVKCSARCIFIRDVAFMHAWFPDTLRSQATAFMPA